MYCSYPNLDNSSPPTPHPPKKIHNQRSGGYLIIKDKVRMFCMGGGMSFNMQIYMVYDTSPEYHNIKYSIYQFHISSDVYLPQSYFLMYYPLEMLPV